MDEPTEQKKRRAIGGPLASWAKKRAEKQRLADLAKQVAQSVAGRVVASAVAAGFVGGAVAEQTIPDSGVDVQALVDGIAQQQVEKAAELEETLARQAADLEKLTGDLDTRIKSLASALSAEGSVRDFQVDAMSKAITDTVEDIDRVTGELDATITDLGNVIGNQNTLGLRSEVHAQQLTTVVAGLDTVSVVADAARANAIRAADAAREASDLAASALDRADAVAEDVASLADQVDALAQDVADTASRVDALADDVAGLQDDVASLGERVDDHEARIAAEEAEPAVVENDYDDSEIRARLEDVEGEVEQQGDVSPLAYVILPSVSHSSGETEVTSGEESFFVPDDNVNPNNGFVRVFYRFSFTPNFTNCGSIELQIDGQFRRSISANNSAGRTISYAASTSLRPGEHTVRYISRSTDNCLIIEPTFELRNR